MDCVAERREGAGFVEGEFLSERVEPDRWCEVWARNLLIGHGFVFQQPLSLQWADEGGELPNRRPKGFVMDFYHPESAIRVEIDDGEYTQAGTDASWDDVIRAAVGIRTIRISAQAVRRQRRDGREACWYQDVMWGLRPRFGSCSA